MKILRFQATLLLSLSPFFPLVCILHAKKTALPAGQKKSYGLPIFLSGPQPPVCLPDAAGLDRNVNHRGLDL